MTTFGKLITAIILIVLGVAIYGAYQYPLQLAVGTSTAGSTFGTAKYAGIAINLGAPGANATSSSVLNTDANDRYVTAIKAGCEVLGTSRTAYTGTNLAALTISIATSSTAAPAANANTNIVGTTALTIATSTGNFVTASSTASTGASAPGSTAVSNIWLAGSYMTFTANATNTGVCTVGVDYIGS